jgi:peptide/nickel transport system substrate-binding protein
MKKTNRILALVLALVLMTAILCACGDSKPTETDTTAEATETETGGSTSEATDETEVKDSLVIGIAQELDDSLDPHNTTAAGTREVLFNVYEGLLKPDTDGNLIPAVASDYTVSDSCDEFTFTLREGVRFHNGELVTVGDIVYSISRAAGLDTGEPLISGLADIASVEAIDDTTVVIKTNSANPELTAYLTAAIIPDGNDPTSEVIGTGPYKFVSRSAQENIVLESFDDYWGEKASIKNITCKIIENSDTLVLSLKSGAIDLASHLTAAQANELGDGFTILEGTMNLVQALYLNNAVEPFNDVRVRQALCYAVNKQEIMDFVADGRGTALGSSIYPAFGRYFMPELADYYTQDIEKAKELLAEAGYPDGFSMTITVPAAYTPHVDTAQVLVEQLAAIGVTATIETVEWSSWLSDVYSNRDFESTVIGFDASALTASALLARWQSDASGNMINFSSEAYDEALANALASGDADEQTEYFKQCEEILAEEAANVYIQDLCDLVAMRSDVTGYEFYPLYAMDFSKLSFID